MRVAIAGLGSALGVVSFVQLGRSAIQAADSMTLLESKLRLVSTSEENLARVQSQVVDLARDTRQQLDSVGELYARLARSSKTLGASQSDILRVTRAVGQAIQISGNTAMEAEAGMIQLSQALASGTLRGDELRSVLEQMPRVAQAIAEGLGVTVGQLRALGAEGRLTSDQVFKALISQTGKLNDEFRKLTPTVGQSMTVLGNELKVAVASLLDATGTTNRLTSAITKLSEAIRAIPSLIGSVEDFFSRFRDQIDRTAERFPRITRALDILTKLSPFRIPGLIDDFLDSDDADQYTRGGGPRRGRQRRAANLNEAVSPVEAVRIRVQKIADDVPAHLRRMSEATRTETEQQIASYNELKATLEALRSEGLITRDQQQARLSEGLDELLPEIDIQKIRDMYKPVRQQTSEIGEFMKGVWQEVGRSIHSTLSDALYDWKLSWRSLLDIARRALADITAAIITSGIKGALKDALSVSGSGSGGGSSFLGSIVKGVGSLFGLASGGNFDGPRIVGEDGPEIVTGRGRVFNARQLAFAGAGQSIQFAPVNYFTIVERENPEKTKLEMIEYFETRTAQQQAEFVRTLQRSGVNVRG